VWGLHRVGQFLLVESGRGDRRETKKARKSRGMSSLVCFQALALQIGRRRLFSGEREKKGID